MNDAQPLGGATFDPALGLFHRGASDLLIVGEQIGWQGLLPVVDSEALVLDLGAHIGSFVHWLMRHSPARRFICVEPHSGNLAVLRRNLSRFGLAAGDYTIEAAAVAMQQTEGVPLYLGMDPALHTVLPIQGRKTISVPTVAFPSLLERNPSVIKCDIEGGEYLLDWSKLPTSVRGVGFEFHLHSPILEPQMNRIDGQLRSQGFAVAEKRKVDPLRKVAFGIYTR